MCYQDGVECEAWGDAFQAFQAENPGVTVVIDIVPYQSILESLPVQLEVGQGPDLARVTDYGGLARYMLDARPHVADAAAIEARYGQSLAWAQVGDNAADGIYNIVDQLTATGGFANATLFEQAAIAMPAPGASWADWAEAARAVRDATGVDFALALDRTGHRFAGPAMSCGAAYFDAAGDALVIDDGFCAFSEQFVTSHEDGTMARDVWAGAGGGYRFNRAVFTSTPARITQAIVGELSLDEALDRLRQDVADAIAAAR
jgi:alpha-1,4-digalacturonate transport system substrate-binding protein